MLVLLVLLIAEEEVAGPRWGSPAVGVPGADLGAMGPTDELLLLEGLLFDAVEAPPAMTLLVVSAAEDVVALLLEEDVADINETEAEEALFARL